jgi:outer membrane protein, heavy metal efflux system
MLRHLGLVLISILAYHFSLAQRLLTKEDAVQSALNNQRNLKAANLSVQQQQQLLRGAAGLDNPQVQVQAAPYEPLSVGVQQSFSLPGVYRNRKALQNERIRLAQLQLKGSQYDLKREVSISYLQLQYLTQRIKLLVYQDSIYQAIKISSKRFFDAGQINKLEELQATTQADRIRNELERTVADLDAEKQFFHFFINSADSFTVEPVDMYVFTPQADTPLNNAQQQILRQQVVIGQQELRVAKSQLSPEITTSILFPTTKDYERPVGYQVGVSIPIWGRQNRSRIAAAKTNIEMIRAGQELEQQRINAQYRQIFTAYRRDLQSLGYFTNTALPQARAIIETSQRLFQGGELNYIESLRNLQNAFDIFIDHLETLRSYNESVIQLNYLNGTL